MLENDTQFSSKKSEKVRNTTGTKFFLNIKISWKIMNFVYQNLHSTKKVHEKNDFSQITHMWSDIDFMDFWKKSIFFEIFCSNLHFKKKNVFFCRFFWNFFCKKVRNTTHTKFFWRFLILCEKCVINRMRSIFFRFQKKNSNWTPVWGGGSKVHFSKSTFWITSREIKSRLFSKSLSAFKG